MPDDFPYDVLLSHSAKDKAAVRPLPEPLRADGLLSNSQLSSLNRFAARTGRSWSPER